MLCDRSPTCSSTFPLTFIMCGNRGRWSRGSIDWPQSLPRMCALCSQTATDTTRPAVTLSAWPGSCRYVLHCSSLPCCQAQLILSNYYLLLIESNVICLPVIISLCGSLPRMLVRGCRIGPLCFLAGWRKRRLNQAFSFVLV